MNLTLIILGIILAINIWLVLKVTKKPEEKDNKSEGLLLLQNQMQKLDSTLNSNIKEIIREVVRVSETGKQMVTFADQLQSLQDILKNPKQRGGLGEYYLETLLKNVLPPGSY